MRTKRSRRELCTQASSLMRLCRPAPLITATGTHVSHCTRIHIRRVLRTLSSPHTLFSVSLSLALSRFGLKHFFRNCIVNNVVLILESAMFPVFMGLMLLFIGPQCCIRPRLAPYYGSSVVRVSLALAGGTFSCCPWYLIRKCISLGFPLFFGELTPFPTFPLATTAFDNADKLNFHWISFQKFSNLIISWALHDKSKSNVINIDGNWREQPNGNSSRVSISHTLTKGINNADYIWKN